MVAVRGSGRPARRMIMAMLLWAVPASFLVSLLLALVQLAINVHLGLTGKSFGPALIVWFGAAVVPPVAVAGGYLVVRVWTAAVWLAMTRSAGRTATAGEAFRAARGLCRQTALVYTAGLAVLASVLVAGSAEFGVLSHAGQVFQATLITAGPTGALAPVALLAVAAVRRSPPSGGRQPASRRLVLGRAILLASGAILWWVALTTGLADPAQPRVAQLAELLVTFLLPTAVIAAVGFMGRRRADGVKGVLPGWPTADARRGQARSVNMLVLLSVCTIAYSALIGFAVTPFLLSSAGGKIIGALVVSAAIVPAGAILISQGTATSLQE
jgi:hypothetical protein